MMNIVEVGTVHERINLLIENFCKGNKTAFGRETDILPGVLASITGGRLSKPSFELLQRIITRYPEVSGDWLILGRGPMLHQKSSTTSGSMQLVSSADFIAEYEHHKRNQSDLKSILRSKQNLSHRILMLEEGEIPAKERLKLGALEADYEELINSKKGGAQDTEFSLAAFEYQAPLFASKEVKEIFALVRQAVAEQTASAVKQAVEEQTEKIQAGQQLFITQFNEQILRERVEDIDELEQEAAIILSNDGHDTSKADNKRLAEIQHAIQLLKKTQVKEGEMLESFTYNIDTVLDDAKPFGGSLAQRLYISEEEAREIVTSGKISSIHITGLGYSITEGAVRKYLKKQRS